MKAPSRRAGRALVLLLLCAIPLFLGCPWKRRKADLILTNGTFFTGNALKPRAEMVAVRGNRILAVGRAEEAGRFRSPSTRVIDLHGGFGCAGFNDAHVHLLSGGQSLEEVDLTGVSNVTDFQRRILERAWKVPWGSWILGRGWDQNRFAKGDWPTRKILDDIAPDFPMVLERVCGHALLVNQKVLSIAGITAKTPDPPAGEIVRDPSTGEPTGVLKEEAMQLVAQYVPAASAESVERALERALEEARRFGVTTLQDYSAAEALPAFRRILEDGRLTARITLWFPLDTDPAEALALRQEYRRGLLRFGLLKGFVDGSMGSRSAWFSDPYSDDSTTTGIPQISPQRLDELVLLADRSGIQVALHAIGDQAVRVGLSAFELAQRINGASDRRHRIEHAQVVSAEDIPRFKSLGVVASMQPAHLVDDMAWAEARLGPGRAGRAYAWRSMLEGGVRLAFGSDWPVVPLNPLIGVYAAVSRCDTAGLPAGGWHPEQRLGVEEALLAFTEGSAYAERLEHEKGSLEAGKLADIVVLNRNLLTAHPADLLRARVVYTVMDGRLVYEENP